MSLLRPAFVAASAGLALAVLLFPSSARASGEPISINVGGGWVHDATAPLFTSTGIVPGWTAAKTLEVRNNTNASATLGISSADVVDNENGCMHSEAVVDHTCGSGPNEGELGHGLVFSIFVDPSDTNAYPTTPAWSGTLYDMQTPAVLSSSMPANAVWGLRIAVALPRSSGNETQTDTVSYSLRLNGSGLGTTDLATSVLGVTYTKGGGDSTPSGIHVASVLGSNVVRAGLPFTGSDILAVLPLGVTLIVGGSLFWLIGLAHRGRRAGHGGQS